MSLTQIDIAYFWIIAPREPSKSTFTLILGLFIYDLFFIDSLTFLSRFFLLGSSFTLHRAAEIYSD